MNPNEEVESIIKNMKDILERKGKDYGPAWEILGMKGLFCRINDKYWRLKHLVWDGNAAQVNDERVEDTLIDLANYCVLALVLLERNKEDSISTEGTLQEEYMKTVDICVAETEKNHKYLMKKLESEEGHTFLGKYVVVAKGEIRCGESRDEAFKNIECVETDHSKILCTYIPDHPKI